MTSNHPGKKNRLPCLVYGKPPYFLNVSAILFDSIFFHCIGSGSVVSIATSYGLDCRGIESRWGRGFSAPVQTGPGAHPASCTMGTGSFPGGKERPGRDADPSPPSSAVGHESVKLYLYSPYGPYGLYRASMPVQGCTLPPLCTPSDSTSLASNGINKRLTLRLLMSYIYIYIYIYIWSTHSWCF